MNKYLIAIFTVVLALSSCRKLVTDEFPPAEVEPVLNAIIAANEAIKVQLSYTANVNGDTISLAQDALVTLKMGDDIIDTLMMDAEGFYVSEILAQEEQIYYCEAKFTDGNIVSTSSYLPYQSKIISYEHIKEAGKDEEGTIYPAVKVTFENNPNEELYFQLLINLIVKECDYYDDESGDWQSDCYDTYRNPELLNITDPLIVNEGLPIPIFSNELIEGDSYTMTLNYTTGQTSCDGFNCYTTYFPLIIELRSISYEYYQYAKQLYLYEQGRYPDVIGDVARVYPLFSNIDNGYGIFASYASCVTDTITVE